MPRLKKFTAAIAALALGLGSAFALASCGSSGGDLNSASADSLNNALDQIEQLTSAGACTDAADLAAQAATKISQQPGLDPDLKDALAAGFRNLDSLASNPATCGSVSTQTTTQETTTTEKTNTEPTTTEEPPPPPVTQTQQNTITTPTQPTTTSNGGTGGNGGGPGL